MELETIRKYFDGMSKEHARKNKQKKNVTIKKTRETKRKPGKSEAKDDEKEDENQFLELMQAKPVPPKFLQPVTFHVIYGDFGLYDNNIYLSSFENKLEPRGLMSVLNLYKKVGVVSHSREHKLVTIDMMNRTENTPRGNWKLLVERLRSQSCLEAKELSDLIQTYCLGFEMEIERRKTDKSLFEVPRVSPSLTMKEKAEYDAKVMQFLEKINGKYFIVLEVHFDDAFTYYETRSIHISESILHLMGFSFQSFYFHTIRNGLPDIFTTQEYLKYWMFPLKDMLNMSGPDETPVLITDLRGRVSRAYCLRSRKISGRFGNTNVINFMVEYRIDKDDENKILMERAERADLPPLRPQNEDVFYRQQSENFTDLFYPNSFPESHKMSNEGKACMFKELESQNRAELKNL